MYVRAEACEPLMEREPPEVGHGVRVPFVVSEMLAPGQSEVRRGGEGGWGEGGDVHGQIHCEAVGRDSESPRHAG